MRRASLARAIPAPCGPLLALPAAAQPAPPAARSAWNPDRPVRLVVPCPPGGATDRIARIFAERACRDLPRRWVIENRSGANGTIGMAYRAQSAPDGMTLEKAGLSNAVVEPWFGCMAPRGTPPAIVARRSALPNEAIADPAVQARLRDLGARSASPRLSAPSSPAGARWSK